jgi:arginine N-succinyltransferase
VFYLRPAIDGDLPSLREAARHLDSVNLPNDEAKLAAAIARSQASFAAAAAGPGAGTTAALPPAQRELLFVLVERAGDGGERVVGSSMVFAQHGSRRSPHIYFDVIDEERYSETLDRHFHHKVLRIGYNYNGLTEIGGLVVLPELRGHPQQLGKALVHVRFLYIALHRAMFRDEIVSELMPPLEPDGTSLLWESLGRHFTGLSYQEADQLSRANKEFIRALFPQDPIYASLLPARAQAQIGEVGPHSKAVEKMLVRAGFRYAHRIDPFDGGPHFHARTDELAPVRAARRLPVGAVAAAGAGAPGAPAVPLLVAVTRDAPPYFRAVRTLGAAPGAELVLDQASASLLEVGPGAEVGVLPL